MLKQGKSYTLRRNLEIKNVSGEVKSEIVSGTDVLVAIAGPYKCLIIWVDNRVWVPLRDLNAALEPRILEYEDGKSTETRELFKGIGEWQQITEDTRRRKVFGGWIVNTEMVWFAAPSPPVKVGSTLVTVERNRGVIQPIAGGQSCFVPDPLHQWECDDYNESEEPTL